ncbi:MAG TPA: ABC transporter ATP-binding protein [Microbacteriaceae bacterium]|nr:ABC transporter ATP-binding protein [Microbacteriaceae bacterium]
MSALLRVTDFTVEVETDNGRLALAEEVGFAVRRGETLCIAGESGSGKSVTVLSIARLLEFTAPIRLSGSATLDGIDLVAQDQLEMSRLRGARIGVVFQEAMEALNPTMRIGAQLLEAFRLHAHPRRGVGRAELDRAGRAKALSLLTEVGMADPEAVMTQYPHQLSGGMQQRVMIAMALVGDPDLLIADEPTTALDVTVQAEILRLLRRLQRQRDMACVLITHDLGIAAEMADRIAVMYAGEIIESGPVEQMLRRPQHPYTKALLECVPRPGVRVAGRLRTIPGAVPAPGAKPPGDRFAPRNALATERCHTEPPPVLVDGDHMVRSWAPVTEWTPELVERLTGPEESPVDAARRAPGDAFLVLEHVNKTYARNARRQTTRADRRGAADVSVTRAVMDLSLTIRRGELFGVVGETGSGKSTLGRLMLDLEKPDPGSRIRLGEIEYGRRRRRRAELELRREIQAVFQDPHGSIDPRQTVAQAITEPMRQLLPIGRAERGRRVLELLDAVGLPATTARKYASELSGGQRQRVAIARAIAATPKLIVADEPTSALDVSVQGQIVNLLLELQRELDLTYVLITHNLSLITSIADRVGVMQGGRLLEVADAETLLRSPGHEYTRRLLESNPDPFAPRP